MKDRLVVWGSGENDKVLFLALLLRPEANEVDIFSFPMEITNHEFIKKMESDWVNNKEVEFPDGFELIVRKMDMKTLLPEDIRVTKLDLIKRAESEWSIRVLSHKVFEMFKGEISALESNAKKLETYDNSVWDASRDLWDKIKLHSQERNLSKTNSEQLRNQLNHVFTILKELKAEANEQFEKVSSANFEIISAKVLALMKEMENSKDVSRQFEALKKVQAEQKEYKFSRIHHKELRELYDKAFGQVKSLRKNRELIHLETRVTGLKDAVRRMGDSLKRDKESLSFQQRRMDSDRASQLEAQLRAAKTKMLEERIESKQDKLDNMVQTLKTLEGKLLKATSKQEKQAKS